MTAENPHPLPRVELIKRQEAMRLEDRMKPKNAASGSPDIPISIQETLSISRRLCPTLQGITSACEDRLVLWHSGFGRCSKENSAGGCDYGAAGMMFLFGGNMRAGLAGKQSSLTDLDANGNMIPTMVSTACTPMLLENLDVPVLI